MPSGRIPPGSRAARSARALVLLLLCVPAAAKAAPAPDEIAEAIARAGHDYAHGRPDAAAVQLERAARLIHETRSAMLAGFLPAPPAGWFAAPASAQAITGAAAGGASSAQREYLQGERVVKVRMLADAPAVQSALQVLASPAFAGMDGGRAVRVRGYPGILKHDAVRRTGRLTLVVAQRYLVSVEGIDVSADTLTTFAEAMDLAALARAN